MRKSTIALTATTVALAATCAWLAHALSTARAAPLALAACDPRTPAPSLGGAPRSWPPRPGVTPAGLEPPAVGVPPPADDGVPTVAPPSFTISESTRRVFADAERAAAKRKFADFIALEGLSGRDAAKFIDSVSSEDAAWLFYAANEGREETDSMRETRAKLAEEIGEPRFSRLNAFAQSNERRALVDEVATQLDGRNVPLGGDQRLRVLRAVIEQHQQDPRPRRQAGMAELLDLQVAEFDQLVALCQPILRPDQMPVLLDMRDSMVEQRRQLGEGTKLD